MTFCRWFACLSLPLLVAATGCDRNGATMDHAHAGPAMNYRVIDERLATGGHFVGDGSGVLAREGFRIVIDLRENPPDGQAERLAALGMQWISIPVSWENPQPSDFDKFSQAMQAHRDDRVFVQCAANYRASAMTYLFRVLADGVAEPEATADLYAVWRPNERWSDYLRKIQTAQGTTAE